MRKNKPLVGFRLREEEREMLKEIARRYDVSEATLIRLALKEFIANHNMQV